MILQLMGKLLILTVLGMNDRLLLALELLRLMVLLGDVNWGLILDILNWNRNWGRCLDLIWLMDILGMMRDENVSSLRVIRMIDSHMLVVICDITDAI